MEPETPASDTLLMDIAIAVLAPLFMASVQGNPAIARNAARQVLLTFRAGTAADLLTVAQIVAFGLATLNTLSLSMGGDLPAALVLRAVGCADRLSKAEQRHRVILHSRQQSIPVDQRLPAPPEPRPAARPTRDAVPRPNSDAARTPEPIARPSPYPHLRPAGKPAAQMASLLAAEPGHRKAPAVTNLAETANPILLPIVESVIYGTVLDNAQDSPAVPLDVQLEWRQSFGEKLLCIAGELEASSTGLTPEELETRHDEVTRLRTTARELLKGEPMPYGAPGAAARANGLRTGPG